MDSHQRHHDNLRAGLYMVAASASFVTNDSLIKLLGGSVPVGQTIAVRGAMSLILLTVLCGSLGLMPHARLVLSKTVIWRALLDLVSTLLFIVALLHMPIANLTSIIQAIPLAVVVLAFVLLGERCGWRRGLAILVGFLGVLLIARPSPPTFTIYEAFAMIVIVTGALRDIVTRRIPAHIPSFVVALSNALFVTMGGVVVGLVQGFIPLTLIQFALLAGASLFLSLGYVFLVMTVRLGDLTVTAPFRYVNVLFSIFSGIVVFGEFPDFVTLLGMALIVASGIYAIHREAKLRNIARTQQP